MMQRTKGEFRSCTGGSIVWCPKSERNQRLVSVVLSKTRQLQWDNHGFGEDFGIPMVRRKYPTFDTRHGDLRFAAASCWLSGVVPAVSGANAGHIGILWPRKH